MDADSVGTGFCQPPFACAPDDRIGYQREADAAKPTEIMDGQERLRRIVIFTLEHFGDVHHGDVATSTVLKKLRIHDRAMMVHDICGSLILADDDICRIAEQLAIITDRVNQCSCDDCVGRIVVLRL